MQMNSVQQTAVTAVIFAGGVGTRMRSRDIPKQFLVIHEKPIIVRTVEAFERCGRVNNVVVACNPDWLGYCEGLLEEFGLAKVRAVVPGGETGQLSIRAGLLAAAGLSDPECTVVLVHDGVRPLVDQKTIEACVGAVEEFGSAITCVRAKETTLVEADDGGLDVVPRERVLLARAPQGFWLSELLAAHEDAHAAGKADYIDSASMMVARGVRLHAVEGRYDNIKITTQDDFYAMRAILDSREDGQLYLEGDDAK